MEGMRKKKHFFLPNQLLNNHKEKKNPLCVSQNFSFSKKRKCSILFELFFPDLFGAVPLSAMKF